jgi:hypothetical protein
MQWNWEDWGVHVLACRGIESGGIYTQLGAVCTQHGIRIHAGEIEAIELFFKGKHTQGALELGGNKYLILNGDESIVQGRFDGKPMTICKTMQLFLIAVGTKDATPGMLSVDLDKIAKNLIAKGL